MFEAATMAIDTGQPGSQVHILICCPFFAVLLNIPVGMAEIAPFVRNPSDNIE
jgi:hypothetical protein